MKHYICDQLKGKVRAINITEAGRCYACHQAKQLAGTFRILYIVPTSDGNTAKVIFVVKTRERKLVYFFTINRTRSKPRKPKVTKTAIV